MAGRLKDLGEKKWNLKGTGLRMNECQAVLEDEIGESVAQCIGFQPHVIV